jgi:hypothetical protein
MSGISPKRSRVAVVLGAVGRAVGFVVQVLFTALGAGAKGNAPLLPPQPPPGRRDEYRP